MGEEVPEGRLEVVEFCLLRFPRASSKEERVGVGRSRSRDGATPKTDPAIPPVVPTVAPLRLVAGVLMLRVERFEDERCRREGVGCEGPEIRWLVPVSGSAMPVDVEEVVDATEAVCCRS